MSTSEGRAAHSEQEMVLMEKVLRAVSEDIDFCRLRQDRSKGFLAHRVVPFVLQFSVQGSELLQKASVGENPAFLLHTAYRGQKSEVVTNHQVGEDQRSRATHAHSAVHKHLSWNSQKTQKKTLGGQITPDLVITFHTVTVISVLSSVQYLLMSTPGE